VFGISTDDRETLKRFKEKLGAPYAFLSDASGEVSRQYVGVIPVVKIAHRANVVVGADGIVKAIVTGGDAVDPSSAIAACPMAGTGS
jgi:peroxiredoxin Q/BCP